MITLRWLCVAVCLMGSERAGWAASTEAEFNGPFASWADLMRDYVVPARVKGQCVIDVAPCFQAAVDALGTPGHGSVLFIPAGEYHLSSTVRVINRSMISIQGDHPRTVRMVWDGGAGDGTAENPGAMMLFSGVPNSRMGRITWDGRGVAASGVIHRWAGYESPEPFPTGFEHADEVFQNMGVGIQGGGFNPGKQSSQSETVVTRTVFRDLRVAGISLNDYNSLNWWVNDCAFTRSGTGVDVEYGQVFVAHSYFENNDADVYLRNVGPSAVRDSFSIHSRVFLETGGPTTAQFEIALQRNTVVNPSDVAVRDLTAGPLTLLDNVFSGEQASVIKYTHAPASLLSIGNTWTGNGQFSYGDGPISTKRIGDRMGVKTVRVTPPVLATTPPRVLRQVFEPVAGDLTGAGIQEAITRAQGFNGQRPVVHLPEPKLTADGQRSYATSIPIMVPAGSDVQIVGDGLRTAILADTHAAGTTLWLRGPTRATIKDVTLWSAVGYDNVAIGDALLIDQADQPGARVFVDMPQGNANLDNRGVWFDGLDHALIEVHHNLLGGEIEALRATGGPVLSGGGGSEGRVNYVQGYPSSLHAVGMDVSEGARVIGQDAWFESAAQPTLAHVASGGALTLDGTSIAVNLSSTPTFAVDASAGAVTLIGVALGDATLGGDGPLPAGVVSVVSCTIAREAVSAGFAGNEAVAALLNLLGNNTVIAASGLSDDAVLATVAPVQALRPLVSLVPLSAGVTDARLYRVGFNRTGRALHVTAER